MARSTYSVIWIAPPTQRWRTSPAGAEFRLIQPGNKPTFRIGLSHLQPLTRAELHAVTTALARDRVDPGHLLWFAGLALLGLRLPHYRPIRLANSRRIDILPTRDVVLAHVVEFHHVETTTGFTSRPGAIDLINGHRKGVPLDLPCPLNCMVPGRLPGRRGQSPPSRSPQVSPRSAPSESRSDRSTPGRPHNHTRSRRPPSAVALLRNCKMRAQMLQPTFHTGGQLSAIPVHLRYIILSAGLRAPVAGLEDAFACAFRGERVDLFDLHGDQTALGKLRRSYIRRYLVRRLLVAQSPIPREPRRQRYHAISHAPESRWR